METTKSLQELFAEVDAIEPEEDAAEEGGSDEITEEELERFFNEPDDEEAPLEPDKIANETLDEIFGSLDTGFHWHEELHHDSFGNEVRMESLDGGPDILSEDDDFGRVDDDSDDGYLGDEACDEEDLEDIFNSRDEPDGPGVMKRATFALLRSLGCFQVIRGKLCILGSAAVLFDEYRDSDILKNEVSYVPVTFDMLKSLGCFDEFNGKCYVSRSLMELYHEGA